MSNVKWVAFAVMALPLSAGAQTPRMSKAEAAQLYTAGGFPIVGNRPVNSCGESASPTIRFLDLNGDKRPEALFVDTNRCYAPEANWFALAAKGQDGTWRQLFGATGKVSALPTRTAGWLDLQWTAGGRVQPLRYNGQVYGVPTSTKPARPVSTPGLRPTGDAALFLAAGFKKRGTQWRSDCDDPGTATYSPGTIESRKDLNGDGRPEAVITEGGTYCYGNTGTGFWLVSQQSDGSWTLMTNSQGVPEFLKTKGVGGWPDILIGGPGFCFPVQRWNGRAYVPHRREYEGKPCK